MKLTDKEEMFCQEYVENRNAFSSAEVSGVQFGCDALRFYVYFLINPITGHIFYVGKGKKKRKDHHFINYKNGRELNRKKSLVFDTIVRNNELPLSFIFKNDLTESDALAIEKLLLETFTETGLTNVSHGQLSHIEQSKVDATHLLNKLTPFRLWVSIKKRTFYEIGLYRQLKVHLRDIAMNGSPKLIIIRQSRKGTTVQYE
jgi:hypothetical protein